MTDTTATASTLSKADAERINRLCHSMPYSGWLGPIDGPIASPERLILWLECLHAALTRHAADYDRDQAELQRLRGLIRGGRQLLAELLPTDG